MPQLSPEQIREKIAEDAFYSISIDTNVFDGLNKNFENTVLKRLDQFHQRDIQIVLTEIVAAEMKSHLTDEAADSQRALKTAIRTHSIRWKLNAPPNIENILSISSDPALFASAQLDEFLKTVNGEIIECTTEGERAASAFSRYFSSKPPFGDSEKRKHEFPDAFALLTLEDLGKQKNKLVLCVSNDKGWQAFAAESDHLVCLKRLDETLAYFHKADHAIAEEIIEAWQSCGGGDFIAALHSAFEYRLDNLDYLATADSNVDYESEPVTANLQFIDSQSIGEPNVIAADAETVTFKIEIESTVVFRADFHFFVVDSIDKDTIFLGSEEAEVEKTMPFELIITADREVDGVPVFHEVELVNRVFEVQFGYIEPFSSENPEHEKY